jgi:uncharacterized membrane protein YkvA (DUF1232 family)
MLEQMDPKTLIKWLILAGLLYFLLPYDLFPDFLGLPGRIDDVLMVTWLAWLYRSRVRQHLAAAAGHGPPGGSGDERSRDDTSSGSKRSDRFDAYEVLGVTPGASSDAIQAAYRSRMMEYHPDKVAHLGVELQKLAHEKSQEIQHAYRQLRE